jgi:prepilin-type N-terminal cleavage/methylation domain-containing protein
MPKGHRGFSLVELLIVVTVLGVLATIGATVYKGNTENAKDQQRLRDLNSIKQALELYRHDERSYPKVITDLAKYLSPIPADPQALAGKQYAYATSPSSCATDRRNCKAFVVCAKKQGNKAYTAPTGCATVACSGTVGDCDMGVTSDDPFLIVPTPTPIIPTPTPASTFPLAGLVSYWKMDETADQSCPGGVDVCDSISSNHGDSGNAAYITNGVIGNGRRFNGSNTFVDIGTSASLRLQRFTISAWVAVADPAQPGTIFSHAGGGNDGGYVFWKSTSGEGSLLILSKSTGGSCVSTSGIASEAFRHVVVTYDGSNCRFYIQGSLVSTIPFTTTFTGTRGFIGTSDLNGAFFNGTIDEVGLWNRALSLDEIILLHNGGAGRQP